MLPAAAQNGQKSSLRWDYPIVFLYSLYWLYPVCANTQLFTHTHALTYTYESSFISWLSVLAIFLGGAGLSPSPCSCSLFFAAFWMRRIKQQSVKITKWSYHTRDIEKKNPCFMTHLISWEVIIWYCKYWLLSIHEDKLTTSEELMMLTFLSHCWWR